LLDLLNSDFLALKSRLFCDFLNFTPIFLSHSLRAHTLNKRNEFHEFFDVLSEVKRNIGYLRIVLSQFLVQLEAKRVPLGNCLSNVKSILLHKRRSCPILEGSFDF
jgi:hypothetical protein